MTLRPGLIGTAAAFATIIGAGVAAAQDTPFTICVVHNNADHPSITAIVNGMNDEAKIYGGEVTYFDPAFDPQKQASMVEDCIARKPSVIAVNAVDPAAVVQVLKKASEAGIPVVMQNANTNEEGRAYTKTFVGSQSFDQGYAVGEMIVKATNGKGKMVMITGRPGQFDVVQRADGVKKAFADAGAEIEILAEEPADWSKDKALTVMQDLLTRYPDIDIVFGQDDPMALGALQAIKANGVEGIKVFGVNGNKDACDAIKAGDMYGTAMQLSYMVGVYSVRAAYDLYKGRQVPAQMLAPTAPVTPENVDALYDQCW
ncbi:MAG TPA: sugar ABC transporter substrate-binding protein [Bauldia sp.]|nr:sugar ABC transporter substrate-binding protein [Bauldia sp.]